MVLIVPVNVWQSDSFRKIQGYLFYWFQSQRIKLQEKEGRQKGSKKLHRVYFDNLTKLISLDNDCMFHFIFNVIYRKPCFIRIKSVRKVMSTTFSEISLVFES